MVLVVVGRAALGDGITQELTVDMGELLDIVWDAAWDDGDAVGRYGGLCEHHDVGINLVRR